ncbi:MAG: hypothetical protein Q9181_006858 [Wetmoreana brouardii]
MTSTSTASDFPDFLFNAWRFRKEDISEARNHNELQDWNVSSLCSAYLKYQLDRQQHQLQTNNCKSTSSLTSMTVNSILDSLSSSTNLQADVEGLAESLSLAHLRLILQHPRTPYKVLRLLDRLPQTTIVGSSGDRKLVDIDEAVFASEQYIRSIKSKGRLDSLVTLNDLSNIFGSLNADWTFDVVRKTPPKGGFEFLDEKRQPVVKVWANDVHFTETFDRVTHGALRGLDWDHVFVAGGMVLKTLLHIDPSQDDDKGIVDCDIDLYLYDLTSEEANRKIEEIYNVWLANDQARSHALGTSSDTMVLKTSKTINFVPKYPNRRVQVILKLLASPLDILLDFDLDACALGFDGSRVLMLPRCARALETGYSVFTMDLIWGHHLGNRRETQVVRVFQYADRGFGLRILPSYVRSLETQLIFGDTVQLNGKSSLMAEAKGKRNRNRRGPVRVIEGEPGLKTLRRIAYLGRRFVHRFYLGEPNPLVKTVRWKREEREEAEAVWSDLINNNIIEDGMEYDSNDGDVSKNILDEGDSNDDGKDEDGSNNDDGDENDRDDEDLDEGELSPSKTDSAVADKTDNRPIIRLCAIDGYSMHEALPDGRKSLGVFELLMRHCEAWRLDAIGLAWLDRTSFASITYDLNDYSGVPNYQWGPHNAALFDGFQRDVDSHNDQLFRSMRRAISDKLNIHHRQGSYVDYLTRRIRRLVIGRNLQSVQEKQLTMPLIIPMDLETSIKAELESCYEDIPHDVVSKLLIQVHDPSKHEPRTATVPPLFDTVNESGNLRYWVISNESMWAGQHRALDEVSELLASLFNWFVRCDHLSDPTTHNFNPRTDNDQCIWHLADSFRRRLILPEASEKLERGQLLPEREACLFRSWIMTPPARVKRNYDEDDRLMSKFQKKLASEDDIPDKLFWIDGDEGTWGDEEGMPVWRD